MDRQEITHAVYAGELDRAVSLIQQAENPVEAMDAFLDAAAKTYWERKDLRGTVTVSRAGIEYGGRHSDDPEVKVRLKALCYNLGSFSWPGWDEPGISADPMSQSEGMKASQINLQLSEDLQDGPAAMAAAHWLIGAHHLALRQFEEAKSSFERAVEYSVQAEGHGEELMNLGYIALIEVLRGNEESGQLELEKVVGRLKDSQHGAYYAEQLDTALRVFTT